MSAAAVAELAPITEQAEAVEDRLSAFYVLSPAREQQLDWFAAVREGVTGLAANEDWRDDEVARRLLVRLYALEHAVHADDGADRHWRVREQVTLMADLLKLMLRRLDHQRLDTAPDAARFIIETLAGVDDREVARLLDVDPKTIANWRAGRVASIRKHPDRVVLVAQLLYELRSSWTPRGLLMWFQSEHPRLGRAPLDVLSGDLARHGEALRELARAERGQLDT